MELSAKEKTRLKETYGPWAIVTGASSGIGLELATQLAKAGLNLVINSRHLDKLQDVETTLKAISTVEIRIVASDVSDSEGIEKIISETSDLPIGLLVASAGYGTSGNFANSSLDSEINMLRVNCEGLLSLTHFYSQKFVQQKRGGIILMSSMVKMKNLSQNMKIMKSMKEVNLLNLKLVKKKVPMKGTMKMKKKRNIL